MKKGRHFRFNILVSSQYYLDLLPGARQQIDYYLLWKGIAESPTLEKMYKDGNPSIDWTTFLTLYQNASTRTKYSFFYAGVRSDDYRCSFDHKYLTEDSNEDDIIDDTKK
jgi:hypothetical protein